MPLESLDKEINIHDLVVEEEKSPEFSARLLFENLKKSLLYDSEHLQWNRDMQEKYGLDQTRYSNVQLLGLVVESLFDKKQAQEDYELLEDTPLYDVEQDTWYTFMDADQGEEHPITHPNDTALLDVIFFEQFNPELAHQKLSNLYDMPGNHLENGIRRWAARQDLSIQEDEKGDVDINLFEVIAQACFDIDGARKMFEDVHEDGICKGELRFAPIGTQLLEIITEAQFDKAAAKTDYLYLKNQSENFGQNNLDVEWSGDLDTVTCLLIIWCEKLFEESATDLQISTPELPETRKY